MRVIRVCVVSTSKQTLHKSMWVFLYYLFSSLSFHRFPFDFCFPFCEPRTTSSLLIHTFIREFSQRTYSELPRMESKASAIRCFIYSKLDGNEMGHVCELHEIVAWHRRQTAIKCVQIRLRKLLICGIVQFLYSAQSMDR